MATIRAIMQSAASFVHPPAWTNQGHYPQPHLANYTPRGHAIDGPDQSQNKVTDWPDNTQDSLSAAPPI